MFFFKKNKRDEEYALLSEMIKLQCKLQTKYSDSPKSELKRKKASFQKYQASKRVHDYTEQSAVV